MVIRSLVNIRYLHLECARVLHESFLWKERSRIRVVQMGSLRSLLGVKRMHTVPNSLMKGWCGVTKRVKERIDEGVLLWSGHVKRIENDGIAERVYEGEYVGSHSLGRLRKRGIDTVKECLKKKGLGSMQARRMVHDRSVKRGFVRGNAWSDTRGMNP